MKTDAQINAMLDDFKSRFPGVTLTDPIREMFFWNLKAKEHFTGNITLEDFFKFVRNFSEQIKFVSTDEAHKYGPPIPND